MCELFFFAGPFFESFYDLGLKKGGPCPESRVGPLSESDNTLCEWGNIWDGSLCEAVRYRVSTVFDLAPQGWTC